jgi:ATP-dependent Lhr-like helicase
LVLETLHRSGALFFGELAEETGLLPSRVELGLAELVTHGCVTSDSFEGLRALLLPQEKRAPFSDSARPRRHKSVSSVEFAGRWSLLSRVARERDRPPEPALPHAADDAHAREAALESWARVLLNRYGVVFRRLLDREPPNASWYQLGQIYRRLEARGEIRGGYFVGGVSGEQFALPEAIGLLRSLRKEPPPGALVTISAADPLNLAGILTPGSRVAAVSANRLVLRDGVPVAALEAGHVVHLPAEEAPASTQIERALRIGQMPAALRRYYA